jgi:hypothetical protein
MEASPLPPSLLSRLAADSTAASQAIAESPLPEAVSTVRSTSDRRLLHLTGRALHTLDSLLEASDPKVRLAAASKVLDTSPATKPQSAAPTESAIPVSAIQPLFSGLAALFADLRSAPAAKSANPPYPTYEVLSASPSDNPADITPSPNPSPEGATP